MKKALFLANCLHHRKFDDRYFALSSEMQVDVIGLDWYHGTYDDNPSIPYSQFTRIKKRSSHVGFLSRASILAKVLLAMIVRRASRAHYDLILANSFDLFVVANIAFAGRVGVKRVYDIADVHPALTERGIYSALLNKIQGLLIGDWTIVVSSPWFYWGYLLKQHRNIKEVYLLENFKTSRDPWPRAEAPNSKKRVILWNGILRCGDSAKHLHKLCKTFPDAVQLKILGDVSQLDVKIVEDLLSLGNVEFGGRYDTNKLETAMAEVDYIWCAELGHDLNSQLLLPNRLYDCVYYSRAAISVGKTAISDVIAHFGIGAVFPDPSEIASSTFFDLTKEEAFETYQNNLSNISKKFRFFDEFLEISHGNHRLCLGESVDCAAVFGGALESDC